MLGPDQARRRSSTRGFVTPTAAREACAVSLMCLGAMTLLSLASYTPTDISLNASGSAEVANWIGPAGAYWADLLLQSIGIGAWALGAMVLLAGCRAFAGRGILPGGREALGTLLLMLTLGTLGQLATRGQEHAYAPGGMVGALVAETLWQSFAGLGAYLLAISFALVALSLTVEGVLSGWGVKGFSVARSVARHAALGAGHSRRRVAAALSRAREQRRARKAVQASLAAVSPADELQAMPMQHDVDASYDDGDMLGAHAITQSDAAEVDWTDEALAASRTAGPLHGFGASRTRRVQPLPDYAPSDAQAHGVSLSQQVEDMAAEAAQDFVFFSDEAPERDLEEAQAPQPAPRVAPSAQAEAEASMRLDAQAEIDAHKAQEAQDARDQEELEAALDAEEQAEATGAQGVDLEVARQLDAEPAFSQTPISAVPPPAISSGPSVLKAAPPPARAVPAAGAAAAAVMPVAMAAASSLPASAAPAAASAPRAPIKPWTPAATSTVSAAAPGRAPSAPVAAKAWTPPAPAAAPRAVPQPVATAARAATGAPAPHIAPVRPQPDAQSLERAAVAAAAAAKRTEPHANYALPPTSLLDYVETVRVPVDPARLEENAEKLTRTLMDYGIDGHVREIRPGPVVTMYEYVPGPGIKLSKIASLADDLAMSMEAMRVRIVAPIPGKGAVGIEIPNDTRETVYLKEIIAHNSFHGAKSPLTMALGKDIEGTPYVAEMARMPHLLVAGATGAGKSVSINAMIMSILFKARPDEVRMIMVDPKMLELSVYEGIPHLLLPVVTDPKKAALALRWATEEMERRYELLSEVGVRGIDGFNAKVRAAHARGEQITVAGADPKGPRRVCEPMPYLLVIVDELADLMMVASREVESSIMRLAQMARAAGIHLILATQRPSVDVLTGVIKANFPTRIAFQVASRHDSRTIIDGNGAEHLLGRGDMLFLSPGVGGLQRVHGAYVSEEEIERTVSFVRAQGAPQYDESILAPRSEDVDAKDAGDDPKDEMYDQAVAIVAETRLASISMIQRRLRIGYNRAARMVEQMEAAGVVGPADGAKPREVLVSAMSP